MANGNPLFIDWNRLFQYFNPSPVLGQPLPSDSSPDNPIMGYQTSPFYRNDKAAMNVDPGIYGTQPLGTNPNDPKFYSLPESGPSPNPAFAPQPQTISFQDTGIPVEPDPLPSPSDTPAPPGQGLNFSDVAGTGGPIGPPMAQPPYQYNISPNPFGTPNVLPFPDPNAPNPPSNPYANIYNQVFGPQGSDYSFAGGPSLGPGAAAAPFSPVDPSAGNVSGGPIGPPIPGSIYNFTGSPLDMQASIVPFSPVGPPMGIQQTDPNVQVFTASNSPPGGTDIYGGQVGTDWQNLPPAPDSPSAYAGIDPYAQPPVAPDATNIWGGQVNMDWSGAPAHPFPNDPGAAVADAGVPPSANVAFPVGPGAVPGASGVDYSYGSSAQAQVDPATGQPIAGTVLGPNDVANMQNFGPNDPFAGLSPSQQAGFNTLPGGVYPSGFHPGQMMVDAAGNLVNAAGNIIKAAGSFTRDAAGNIIDATGNIISSLANNIMNDPSNTSFGYLNQMGYQPGQGFGSQLPPQTGLPTPAFGPGYGPSPGALSLGFGPLPGASVGGDYGMGYLTQPFQNAIGGAEWLRKRPMTPDQWQAYTGWENYQGNALAGVNWRQWAQQTGNPMPQSAIPPNYQAYLNQWNLLQPVIRSVAAARRSPVDVTGHIPGGGSQSHGTAGTHTV